MILYFWNSGSTLTRRSGSWMKTRIISVNFLLRHDAHEGNHTVCTDYLSLSQMVIEKFKKKECPQWVLLFTWEGTMIASHEAHSIRTSGRNVEKMYTFTIRRYFRRRGSSCEDLWKWSQCQDKFDFHFVECLLVWSELSQSNDCRWERPRASSGLHSRQREEEGEVVQVQDGCFHLAESHSTSLFSESSVSWLFRSGLLQTVTRMEKFQERSVDLIQRSLFRSSKTRPD